MEKKKRVLVSFRYQREVMEKRKRAPVSFRYPGPRPRPGFPKLLACLKCGRERLSEYPADRVHPECRARLAELDDGAEARLAGLRAVD